MRAQQTTKCIVCLRRATSWSGVVLKSQRDVSAGFCVRHERLRLRNMLRREGCLGGWHKMMGLQTVDL